MDLSKAPVSLNVSKPYLVGVKTWNAEDNTGGETAQTSLWRAVPNQVWPLDAAFFHHGDANNNAGYYSGFNGSTSFGQYAPMQDLWFVEQFRFDGSNMSMYFNGTKKNTFTWSYKTGFLSLGKTSGSGQSVDNNRWDDLYIAEYVFPEPQIGLGAEQNNAGTLVPTTTTTTTTLALISLKTPTETNGATVNRSWAQLNASSTASISGLALYWNGTNYGVLDSSLALAYNFNNLPVAGDSITTVGDISSKGHAGNISGAVWSKSGKYNGAMFFDGVDDKVDVNGTLGGASEITVMAWVNVNATTGTFQSIVATPDSCLVHMQLNANGNIAVFTSSGGINLPIIPQTPTGVWRHVAITAKSGNLTLYHNGSVVGYAINTFANITPCSTVKIGTGISGRNYKGLIDEVRIYNRALSQKEIALFYQSELQKYSSTEWRFYGNLTGLAKGKYSYYFKGNKTGGSGTTETRTVTVNV
jgi:hypothetical protein